MFLTGLLIALATLLPQAPPAEPETWDVVVYGGTSAGVAAAVTAARGELRVLLIEPGEHLGGLSSGGLGMTDFGRREAIGGLAREFYRRLADHYRTDGAWRWQSREDYRWFRPEQEAAWRFEPHVAEAVFDALVAEAGVVVARGERLDRDAPLARRGDRIAELPLESGRRLAARVFVDATYEGDLMAAAGSPTRRWRLLVGDAPAAEAVMGGAVPSGTRVHHQRYMTVDHDAVPSERELPDPGLRRAVPEDLDRLANLAVRLHVDDEFGPDPGRPAYRGYRDRLMQTVDRGLVWVVGPVGAPFLKLERSVSSPVWGVQLSGIVSVRERRGQGLGRAAVAAAVRGALVEGPPDRPVSLHVRHANTPARTAYAAAGFVDREEWRLAVRS